MNSLTEEQKYEVRKEIESVLRKKTREVLDEVEKKCPFANRHQISGVLSGMNTNKIIKCDELILWVMNNPVLIVCKLESQEIARKYIV